MNTGSPWIERARSFSVLLFVAVTVGWPCAGTDWPQYRGPNHDGISADRIQQEWSGALTNPLWRVLVPNAISSLTVSGGRVLTQTRRTIQGVSKDVCVALSITNGAELWATPVENSSYPEGGVGFDDGPRSTPSVDDGSVYVLSSYIKLYRLNATNGAVIWQKDLRTLYGGNVIGWQNAASPLIEGGLIYVNANCGTNTLLALRTSDGGLAWRSQDEAMTHSTPVMATIHGVRQVIFATQSGLVSVEASTGNPLWRSAYPFVYGTSLGASPVVYDDMVFATGAHSYGMGTLVVQVGLTNETWTATRLWYANTSAAHWMTPVAYQGFLYGQFGIQQYDSPTAQLKCIDMRTGAVRWSTNGFGRGATLLVDSHLLTITERGDLVLSEPNTNAYTEFARCLAIPFYFGDTNKCWNAPAVSDGRVYVRSTAYVAAFDFSVPGLKLDPPALVAPDQLFLTVRTANGAALDTNRLASLEVRASADPAQPLAQWVVLTNRLVLTNGAVRINNFNSGSQPQQFFIVNEPK